jgi:uncharacterized protein
MTLAPITIRYPFSAARPSLIVGQVTDLFGLNTTERPHTIVEELQLELEPNELVLCTGPSGSGKSSILRAVAAQLGAHDAANCALPMVPLAEALPGDLPERLATLAGCGLSEARLLLRTAQELSDGQRYRFRMAYALATLKPTILLDEFTALLDRTLAKVVAWNLRKLVTRTGTGVLAATTHEDIVEDLNPDVWIRCEEGGGVRVLRNRVKKNESPSTTGSGSPMAPEPTGRTSLGGITEATTSRSLAG